jgi:hypothetical protein
MDNYDDIITKFNDIIKNLQEHTNNYPNLIILWIKYLNMNKYIFEKSISHANKGLNIININKNVFEKSIFDANKALLFLNDINLDIDNETIIFIYIYIQSMREIELK